MCSYPAKVGVVPDERGDLRSMPKILDELEATVLVVAVVVVVVVVVMGARAGNLGVSPGGSSAIVSSRLSNTTEKRT
jgi:hypothetical protein